jgi:hypothetical protein
MNGRRFGACATLLIVLGLAAACGRTGGMQTVPQATVAPPGAAEAVVVFMRPALATGYSTSVFELRPDGDRFIGILRPDTRLAYRTTPGRTRFMLVTTGGWDDFMDAELAGGKTYAAVVTYVTSGGQAGYRLRPVRRADYERDDVKACMTGCAWVENTAKSEAWGKNHLPEIARRKAKSLPEWQAVANRPSLTPADGR